MTMYNNSNNEQYEHDLDKPVLERSTKMHTERTRTMSGEEYILSGLEDRNSFCALLENQVSSLPSSDSILNRALKEYLNHLKNSEVVHFTSDELVAGFTFVLNNISNNFKRQLPLENGLSLIRFVIDDFLRGKQEEAKRLGRKRQRQPSERNRAKSIRALNFHMNQRRMAASLSFRTVLNVFMQWKFTILIIGCLWLYWTSGSKNDSYTKDPACQCGSVVYADGTNISRCGIWDLEPYEWCYLAGGARAEHCPEAQHSTRRQDHPDTFWSPAPCRKQTTDGKKTRYLFLLNWVAILVLSVLAYTHIKRMLWAARNRHRGCLCDSSSCKHQTQASCYHAKSAERGLLKQWQVQILQMIPTRAFSYVWGRACALYLPRMLRAPIMRPYISYFGVNMDEAEPSDVTSYQTFNEFFTRKLRAGVRNVSQDSCMVSPADCKVLSFGKVSPDFTIEQIKGLSYPLKQFLGPQHPFLKQTSKLNAYENEEHIDRFDHMTDEYETFYCSLYLGPGDYHWFHSPTEWTIEHRRHIPGHLFSVNPMALRAISGLFNFNERVLLSGVWRHGPLMYAAVGAYNVGSIELNNQHEQDLRTNWDTKTPDAKYLDRSYPSGVRVERADVIGRFNLGSTIVMAFRAPKNFQWNVSRGDKLKYGQPLGSCTELEDDATTPGSKQAFPMDVYRELMGKPGEVSVSG